MIAKPAVQIFEDPDPPSFVLDEFAGMMTAMLFVPVTPANVLVAFLLFRLLDILKPLGIRAVERIPHPMSIMLDDLLAGIYTNIALQVFIRIY